MRTKLKMYNKEPTKMNPLDLSDDQPQALKQKERVDEIRSNR